MVVCWRYDLITPCAACGRNMRLTAVTEVVGWSILSGEGSSPFSPPAISANNPTFDASGISIVNLKIGPRLTWGQNSLYAGWGHALTEQAWYRDIGRIEYCRAF